MTYRTLEELTLGCLTGAKPDVKWPVAVKRLGEGHQFGLLHKAGERGFTVTPPGEKCAIKFESADAVVRAGWLVA